MGLVEKLELFVNADMSQGVTALQQFASEADKSVSKAESSLQRFASASSKIGASGLGVGSLLTALGSAEQAASQQLEAAVSAAGQSIDEFQGRIDSTISKMEGFDHSAVDTQNALNTLVGAYGDTGKALDEMQLVADLAAKKHESLAEAATVVAKAHGGAARVFKEFNIQVGLNADGTKDYDGALTQLSQKLTGQASAASDTFLGHAKALGIELEDDAAKFGEKYGPAILGVSTLLTALGPITSGVSGLITKLSEAHAAAAAAAEAQTAAEVGLEGASGGLGASLLAAGALAAPLALVLPLMKIGLDGNAASAKETAREIEAFSGALNDANGASDDAVNKAIALNIANSHVFDTVKSLGVSVTDMASDVRAASPDLVKLNDSFRGAAANTSDFANAIINARSSTDPFVVKLLALHDAGQLSDDKFKDLVGNTVALGNELGTAKTKITDATTVQEALGGTTAKTKEQIDQEKKAVDEASKALDNWSSLLSGVSTALEKSYGDSLSAKKSTESYESSINSLIDTLGKEGFTLDESADKSGKYNEHALKNAAAAEATGASIASLIKQRFDETHSIDAAVASGEVYVQNLRDQLAAAGYTKDQVQQLIETMNLTPDQIKTEFSTNAVEVQVVVGKYLAQLKDVPADKRTAFEAQLNNGQYDQVNKELDDLAAGRTVNFEVEVHNLGQITTTDTVTGQASNEVDIAYRGSSPRAMGGTGMPGQSYFIEPGTHGEYFTPSQNGWFTPSDQARASGGSPTEEVHQHFYGPSNAEEQQAEAARRLRIRAMLRAA